jgi:CTP synthase (UTP-ammonia lyase)
VGSGGGRQAAIPLHEVTIAMVGKYIELLDAYKSLIEAMKSCRHSPAAPRST